MKKKHHKSCRRKLATICYLTPFGWFFSYFNYTKMRHSSLVNFHLKQSFGLSIIGILLLFVDVVFFNYKHPTELIYLYLLFLCYIILGIDNSTKGIQKPLPFIGYLLNKNFKFIKWMFSCFLIIWLRLILL